ncbi:hypothetical protein FH972_006315 [Carpinus fangiana]|uniref:Uncharacterized protein n=1 Tax=Carpinus fangiana TaxID=176857 RepID=A0A5N6QV61_9ROSI|nr:hypothetical protein FH972_006315 [Carpinus fangiana]
MEEPKPTWKKPIINYYHKTYVRRRPRRQLRWRPKTLGRKEQKVAGDSPETGWISLSGKLNVTDQVEIMEQTNRGSLKAGKAESGGTVSIDDGTGDPKATKKGTECTETFDYLYIDAIKDMGQLVGKVSQAGKASQDPTIASDSAGDPAKNKKEPDYTETLDHILKCGSYMDKQSLGAFTS